MVSDFYYGKDRPFTARFGVRGSELIYEKFKNLKQDGSAEHYCEQFALCMGQLKVKMPHLSEDYFVECFISGLQEDVKQVLKLLSPNSIKGAFKSAKYCAQVSSTLQTKKAGGKQTGSMGVGTMSKGEISQKQEVPMISSDKRNKIVNPGILQEQTNAKTLYSKGVKGQDLQGQKRN